MELIENLEGFVSENLFSARSGGSGLATDGLLARPDVDRLGQ